MVESLQWGLQGHVSSVPRKGRTLVGTFSAGSQRVPRSLGSWQGLGGSALCHARASSPAP